MLYIRTSGLKEGAEVVVGGVIPEKTEAWI
jgi:hypothetical protein